MKVIKKTKEFELNKGNGMAIGLYNISSRVSDELSYWFDYETKSELMSLNATEFNAMCKNLCTLSVICY